MPIKNSEKRVEWKIPAHFQSLSLFTKLGSLVNKKYEIEAEFDRTEDSGMIDFLAKQFRKIEFLKPSILICYLTYRGDNKSNEDLKKRIKKIIGNIIKEIVWNIEKPNDLPKTDFKDESYWIKGTLIEDLINNIDDWKDKQTVKSQNGPTWIQYTQALIAHSLGMSKGNVQPYITAGLIADINLRRLIFCLLMQALFIFVFTDKYYSLDIEIEDSILGETHIRRYFDGFLSLPSSDNGEKIYLLKLINLAIADNQIVDMVGIAVQDAKKSLIDIVGKEPSVIVFAPGYASSDSQERELFWKREAHVNLNLLYCADFFEILRLWNKEKVERFLVEKLK